MEVFDGFIAAIASEFKISFHKTQPGVYTTVLEFEGDTSQEVLIMLSHDESGDRVINYYSSVCNIKSDYPELYKYALELNSTLQYGALALLENNLIIRDTLMLDNCNPERFMKSLTYIAAKADELEEILLNTKQ